MSGSTVKEFLFFTSSQVSAIMNFALFALALLAPPGVIADLRMGNGGASSHPRGGFRGCISSYGNSCHGKYIIPSPFGYQGLGYPGGQKYNNYDQFLRSNIDNEQDNRNFNDEEGMDHLPFRSHKMEVPHSFTLNRYDGQVGGTINLKAKVKVGESMIVPLRWNNPHASEMEVNVWIFDWQEKKKPLVVPIRKPTCSGEGYQNNVIRFTIPKDFASLGSKIPGFNGCNDSKNQLSTPMCVLQIYSHSVESRQYAAGFPIIIEGHNSALTTQSAASISPMSTDPWYDLSSLRDLCLPTMDLSADITTAVPRYARLVSDVYTHSYMNSDFSPYSGQQQEFISKNLQTSAVNKMVTGNRGELGRSILTAAQYSRVNQLQTLEDRIYKNYEAIANKVIRSVGSQMKNTGEFTSGNGKAKLATCFRCAEVGSVGGSRIQTNTYIPSFQLPSNLVARARGIVPSRYSELISSSGQVRIYEQSMLDLMPFFFVSQRYGIVYQEAAIKEECKIIEGRFMGKVVSYRHCDNMPDVAKFKKRDAHGKLDKGVYASTTAKLEFAAKNGCQKQCLVSCESGEFQPIIQGAKSTCISGECSGCTKLFGDYHKKMAPKVTKLAKDVVKSGVPGGMGSDAVKGYPDRDGSPRIGRPTQQPGDVPFPTVTPPSWDLSPGSPTKPSPTKEITWKIPMSPQAITVEPETKVTFKWSGYHNLAEASEENFNTCNKNGNKEIAPGSNGGDAIVPMGRSGTRYFMCEIGGHCQYGQKIAITVEGSPSPSPSPSPTPSPSPSPTMWPAPSPSPTTWPSPSPSPTTWPSPSPSPTTWPSPSPSPTPTMPATRRRRRNKDTRRRRRRSSRRRSKTTRRRRRRSTRRRSKKIAALVQTDIEMTSLFAEVDALIQANE